jgi:hypothetical protein
MAHPSWGPGWPDAQTSKMKTLARSDGLKLGVRQEAVELFALLLDETERRGYDVKVGQTWGFANRAIRGTSRPSNHSWGLAIDINSLSNPQRRPKTTDLPAPVVEMWKNFGFRWGGDYQNSTPDTMHFEYLGSVADCARHTEIARRQLAGGAPVVVVPDGSGNGNGSMPAFPGVLKLNSDNVAGVKMLQARLNQHGNSNLAVDGSFGSGTKKVVEGFQRAKGLDDDGIVGLATWKMLWA